MSSLISAKQPHPLDAYRKKAGMTIPSLSKASGLSTNTIQRIQRGETRGVREDTAVKYLKACGIHNAVEMAKRVLTYGNFDFNHPWIQSLVSKAVQAGCSDLFIRLFAGGTATIAQSKINQIKRSAVSDAPGMTAFTSIEGASVIKLRGRRVRLRFNAQPIDDFGTNIFVRIFGAA